MATINIGKIAITPKGTWNSANKYEKLDFVHYNGNGYICINNTTSGSQTPTDTKYWMLAVQKGAEGGGTEIAQECNKRIDQLEPIIHDTNEKLENLSKYSIIQGAFNSGLVSVVLKDGFEIDYNIVKFENNDIVTKGSYVKIPLASRSFAGLLSPDEKTQISDYSQNINEIKGEFRDYQATLKKHEEGIQDIYNIHWPNLDQKIMGLDAYITSVANDVKESNNKYEYLLDYIKELEGKFNELNTRVRECELMIGIVK